ncbi:MAG TPA: fatty acid desaturase [Solirubrobacteraceae bacterium]|nr:fatty acid desaturase [Solirubrobacteraceae bacterium]
MPKLTKYANLGAVVIPFVAFVVAVVLLWNKAIGPIDLAIFFVMYIVTGLGITVGYHRLLTHRAFSVSKPVEYAFAVAGTMAVEGPPIAWVADHRKHHAHTDVEGDPHSPHVGHGSGLKGLWFAHTGWLMKTQGSSEFRKYAPDLCEDKGMRWISRNFLLLAGVGLLIPFAAGFVLHGFSLTAALWTLLWAGFVRIFFIHHVTWSINSVCHFFGRRRFDVEDKSTNVAWLAIPTFGESWHHNHHAFPRSARQGLGRFEVDLSAMLIWTLEKLGLAHNVVRISPERQKEKLAAAARAAKSTAAA